MRTLHVKFSWFPKGCVFRTIILPLIIIDIPHKNQGCLWVDFIRHYYPSGFINVEKSSKSLHKNSIIVHRYLLSDGQLQVDTRAIILLT